MAIGLQSFHRCLLVVNSRIDNIIFFRIIMGNINDAY